MSWLKKKEKREEKKGVGRKPDKAPCIFQIDHQE